MENTNNIKIEDMDCWAVDDWAAFGISLWTLQKSIKEDPAYISEAIDILDGIRKVMPQLSLVMRKYAADVAVMIAGLCVDCIKGIADDCQWTAHQVTPPLNDDSPEDDDGDGLDLPPEWFDVLGDDNDD